MDLFRTIKNLCHSKILFINFQKANISQIYFYLLILTFLTRFSYFSYSYLCNDVMTANIVGRDILSGGMPYINYWDNKGPLYYFFHYPKFN